MRADEVRGVSQLAGATLRGSTTRIHEFHQGIAERVFGAVGPAGRPVQRVHDAIAGLTYSGVRLALGAGALASGTVAARAASGRSLDEGPDGRGAVGVRNGAHGAVVRREAPALALGLTGRVDGRAGPVETAALREAFP